MAHNQAMKLYPALFRHAIADWAPSTMFRFGRIDASLWPCQPDEEKRAFLLDFYVALFCFSRKRDIRLPGRLHGIHLRPDVVDPCSACWLGATGNITNYINTSLPPDYPTERSL